MPNDNIPKEQEKTSGEGLREPESREKLKCISCLEEKEEYVSGLCKECADKMDKHIITNSIPVIPNIYYTKDVVSVSQDIEKEAIESIKLKESLGI